MDESWWVRRLVLTLGGAGLSCLKVVDITIGGTTEQWFHWSGSCPAWIAIVAKPFSFEVIVYSVKKCSANIN